MSLQGPGVGRVEKDNRWNKEIQVLVLARKAHRGEAGKGRNPKATHKQL